MKRQKLILVTAIFLGWMPISFLWFDQPPLMGDEAYYARVPVEMRERGDWIVPHFNGEPRYKKPPLMYWLVALSQAIFGENEFASRLPSFFAVVLTGFLLIWFGFKIGSTETGFWAATAFLLNPMTAVLGNWGAPEAMLCLFVAASTLFGFLWLFGTPNLSQAIVKPTENLRATLRWLLLSGIAAGFGVMTKGAPGLVLPLIALLPIAIWKSWKQRAEFGWVEIKKTLGHLGLWFIACLAVSIPWFVSVWLREGEKFLQVFLLREHIQRVAEPMEGHRGPIWFYLPIVWILFSPWSVCLPYAFTNALKNFCQSPTVKIHSFDFPMAWWALSVVALFSLIATKLPHYIFPAFPALSWLVASQVRRNLSKGEFWLGLILASLPVLLIVYSASATFEAYTDFLSKTDFKVGVEVTAMKFAAYSVLIAFASVPLVWFLAAYLFNSSKSKKALSVSGAILTFSLLLAVYAIAHASGGRSAAKLWTKSQNIAIFGSDAEWSVFYAKRSVPMLGRSPRRLREFLAKYPDAAILARVDFSATLRQEGLTLKRFGIWCVAFQNERKR